MFLVQPLLSLVSTFSSPLFHLLFFVSVSQAKLREANPGNALLEVTLVFKVSTFFFFSLVSFENIVLAVFSCVEMQEAMIFLSLWKH